MIDGTYLEFGEVEEGKEKGPDDGLGSEWPVATGGGRRRGSSGPLNPGVDRGRMHGSHVVNERYKITSHTESCKGCSSQ